MEQLARLKEYLRLEIELVEEITSLYADLKRSLIERDLVKVVGISKKLETKGLQFKLLLRQRERAEEGVSMEEGREGKRTLAEIASSLGDTPLGAQIVSLCGRYGESIEELRRLSALNSSLLEVSRSSMENLEKIINIIARKDATYGSRAELSQPNIAGVKVAERA